VRRFAASFFLFVYLFANTGLLELAKIGAFVAHYAEHRQENKNLTLVEFIKIHYFSGNIVDEDYARDMQLPFKTLNLNNLSPTPTLPPPTAAYPTLPDYPTNAAGLPVYDQSALPSSHLADIWQPPKAC
jgi:hypothetical protein